MKHSLLIILFSAALLSFTQAADAQEILLGPRGGLNLANENVEDVYTELRYKAGLIAGLELDVNITSRFAVAISMMYDQKGAVEGSASRFIDYLEFPLVAKLFFLPGTVRPYIAAGPSFGVLLGASFDPSNGPTVNIEKEFRSTDLSLVAAVGLAVALNVFEIHTEVGYAFGLNDINQNNTGSTSKSKEVRSTVALLFPF